ncbi:CD225/dispanin family protein, partial [Myxococcota bacterium]|nr:CD225/dispanin family protein [Myxococcota bacterium]
DKGFTIRIGGLPVAVTPMKPLWLMPGSVRVTVIKSGYVEQSFSVLLAGGDRISRVVRSITHRERTRKNRLLLEAREKKKALILKKKLEYAAARKKFTYRRQVLSIIGITALAVGGVALIAGGYYGLNALGPSDRVESAPRDTWWVDVRDDYELAQRYNSNARILSISGAVFTVVGVAVLIYCKKFLTPRDPVLLDSEETP